MRKDYQILVSVPPNEALRRLSFVLDMTAVNPFNLGGRDFIGGINGPQFNFSVRQRMWMTFSAAKCWGRVDSYGSGSAVNFSIDTNSKTSYIFVIVIGLILIGADVLFGIVDVFLKLADDSTSWILIMFSELWPFLGSTATLIAILTVIILMLRWKHKSDEKKIVELFPALFRDVMLQRGVAPKPDRGRRHVS